MTDETIRAKLSGIRCFLLDMDGTFYLGDRIIPGGLEFLDVLCLLYTSPSPRD